MLGPMHMFKAFISPLLFSNMLSKLTDGTLKFLTTTADFSESATRLSCFSNSKKVQYRLVLFNLFCHLKFFPSVKSRCTTQIENIQHNQTTLVSEPDLLATMELEPILFILRLKIISIGINTEHFSKNS